MPKINLNGNTGSILYDKDDFLVGISGTSGDTFDHKFGNGLMQGVDPLRNFGYLSPGFEPVNVTNVSTVASYLRNAVINGTSAYILSSGALLHQLTSILIGTITNAGIWPHTITGSGVAGDDTCNYFNGSGTLCQFYSYNYSGGWNVGTYDFNVTFDDDFMSTVPTTPLASPYIAGGEGYPHPVIQGDDDILYIGDRHYIHSYEWSTNTFATQQLLPKGWIITSFCKTQDLRLAVGAYLYTSVFSPDNKGSAKVWIWSYGEPDVDYAIDLKDNYVAELVPWANTIAAFTKGPRSISDAGPYKLQYQTGTQFEVAKSWSIGGLPIRGGVDSAQNDLYWNAAGQLMAYTRNPENGRYILTNPITTLGTTSGLLKFLTSTRTIHASSGSTTTGGLAYCSGDFGGAASDAVFRGEVAEPKFDSLHQGKLTNITIKFKNTASGGRTLRLNTFLNTTDTILITDFSTVTNQRVTQIKTRSDGSPLGTFSTLTPNLIWQTGSGISAAPIIDWIKYEFELTNI